MADNLYDDTLEHVGAGSDQAPADNPYAQTLRAMDAERQSPLRASLAQAVTQPPDHAADVQRLSQQTGIPAPIIARNFDAIRQRGVLQTTPFSSIHRETPQLAKWASNPDNAAVAHDDLENLGTLEWLVTAPQRAFAQTVNQIRFAQLRSQSIYRPLTQAERDEMASARYNMNLGGRLGAEHSWFREAVLGLAQLVPNVGESLLYGADYAVKMAAEGVAVGGAGGALLGGVGAIPGAIAVGTAGASAGFLYGAAKFAFDLQSGLAYDEYSDFKDELGRPLDPTVAKAAAVTTGLLTAGLQTFGLGKLLETVPGLERLSGPVFRSAVKQALRQPSVRQALTDAIGHYAVPLTIEAATQTAIRGADILGGELAKTLANQKEKPGEGFAHRSPDDVGRELVDTFTSSLAAFALGLVPGPLMRAAREATAARRAARGPAFFEALAGGLRQSKTAKRMPEAMRTFVEQATKDGPLEHVYAPTDAWATYWQEQHVDPRAMAAEVTGDPEAYDRALREGSDLKIPTAAYAAKLAGTKHNAPLSQVLRLGADEMNAVEAHEFLARAQATRATELPRTSADQVEDQLLRVLQEGGQLPATTAAPIAKLYRAFFGQLAEDAGVDPAALYNRYGLQVDRPDLLVDTTRPAEPTVPGVPELARLERELAGASIEVADQGVETVNASGESAASLEAIRRQAAMNRKGERFVVYDRAGRRRPIIGPEAVDYQAQAGETFGVEGPSGFQVLDDRGGRPPVDTGAPAAETTGANHAEAETAPTTGLRAANDRAQRGAPHGPGSEPGGGHAEGVQSSGVSETPAHVEARQASVFKRRPAAENRARLTPAVLREVRRIYAELDNFRYQPRSWDWDTGTSAPHITAGTGGAPVHHDILAEAPYGREPKSKLRTVKANRATTLDAAARVAEDRDIPTHIAEGVVRVAELRAQGAWKRSEANPLPPILKPLLPDDWDAPPPEEVVAEFDAALDEDLKTGERGEAGADPTGFDRADEDISFNPEEYEQGPRPPLDLLGMMEAEPRANEGEPAASAPADVLDTGEAQPRLPGDVGAVRETENQTPEFEAPFSLTSEVAKSPKGRQTTLFQALYHGTPHDFEHFSLQHVGTGEGAAAYGWGLYFAENPKVAAEYHDRLAGQPEVERLKLGRLALTAANDFDYTSAAHVSDVENVRAALAEDLLVDPLALIGAGEGGFRDHVLRVLDDKIRDYATEGYPEGVAAGKALRAELEKKGALAVKFSERTGGVYTVDIPDRHLAKMLDWDAPLAEQPNAVKDVARATLKELGYLRPRDNGPRVLTRAFDAYINEHGTMAEGPTGEGVYNMVAKVEADRLTADLRAARDAIDARYPKVGAGQSRFTGPDGERDFKEWTRLNGEIAERRGEAAKLASEKLAAAGVPGLRYLDQGSRRDGRGTRNVVVFDDSIVTLTHKNGKPFTKAERDQFFQGEGRQARGSIQFGPDRAVNISLFERADLSTMLHETGHLFLEVFGDVADQVSAIPHDQLTGDQKRVLENYGNLLQALGVENRAGIGREQHEAFAQQVEAYLMRGKAPSAELRGAFATFRAWLIGVYRSLKGLGAKLQPEVARVLDRLLASDDAIGAAESERGLEPLFTTAESAGMTDAEFALYRGAVAKAGQQAREELDHQLLRDVQREQTATWKAQRAEIATAVRKELEQQPVYRALAAIRRGTTPSGESLVAGEEPEPMKLDRDTIEARYGTETLRALPAFVARRGGVDPDVVAALVGYDSGDALIKAITEAPGIAQAVDRETARRMIAEHGDLLLDGSLPARAREAVADQMREEVIRAELRALAKLQRTARPFERAAERRGAEAVLQERRERAYERRWFEAEAKLRIAIAEGRKQAEIDALRAEVKDLEAKARGGPALIRAALPPTALVQQAAADRIAGLKVGAIRPVEYWAAAKRARTKAIEAAARQDFDAAITGEQDALLNLHLYREARKAQDEIEARVKRARGLQAPNMRALLGRAGDSYVEQVDGILDRYEFAKVSQKALQKRASLRKWVEALTGQGLPVELPEALLDEVRRVNYRELTVDELRGVVDGLDQIVHLARLKDRLLKSAKQRDFEQTVGTLTDTLLEHKKRKPRPLEFTPKDDRARRVAGWFASHTTLAEFVRAFDGFEEGGPWWEHVLQPLNEAATKQAAMNLDATRTLTALIDQAYTPKDLRNLHVKEFIPAIGGSLTKEARLAVALNWGNEGNRDRIRIGRKWTDEQVGAILDTLDERDWRFVQGMWDYIDSFWPEIVAKQKRVVGVAPEKVQPSEVVTKFGTFKGGYYPLAYDGRLSPHIALLTEASDASLQAQAAYVHATTRRGHLEARQQRVNEPVRLELSVGFEHVQQVIHDLTHHEALIDASRILNDRRLRQVLNDTHGDAALYQLKEALKDIAFGPAKPTQIGERALNYLRSGVTIAGLGWNMWTAVQQPLGVFNGMVRVGPRWVLSGMGKMFRDAASLESSAAFIHERSEMMRLRSITINREIRELRDTIRKPGGWLDEALRTVSGGHLKQQDMVDSFLSVVEWGQQLADMPVWLGAFEKARAAGEDEGRAGKLADQAVLDSQGGGQIKDLAQVRRGGPAWKLFTQFYHYGNVLLNQTRGEIGRFRAGGSVGQLVGNLALLYIAPAAMTVLIAHAFGKSTRGDWWDEMGERVIADAMNTMILAREVAGGIETLIGALEKGATTSAQPPSPRGYEGPAGVRAFGALNTFLEQAAQGVPDRAFLRATEETAGILLHLPVAQAQRMVDGFAALTDGVSRNPLVILTGPPPKSQQRAR